MNYNLEKHTITHLYKIAEELGIPLRTSKTNMIKDIEVAFGEYENYKKEKVDKYTKCSQLGFKGKEGTTFLVKDKQNKEYAMKTFRNNKSSDKLKQEFEFQSQVCKKGICPEVYDFDTVSKYIVMEKMESHFYDNLMKNKGVISQKQQIRFLEIFNILDENKIFHNDANLYNFMIKNKQLYIIDFGLAKEITPKLIKKLGTSRPNFKLMSIAMILKFKDLGIPIESYSYILNQMAYEDVKKFGLDK
jgi:tRNA A-37 threonylcarbamoyl transferase component Bud32